MDRCQRADYSIERRGYERDEPRFELIFRKSKTRSSTPSSYVYPVIPAGHCFRFDSTEGEGRSRKQLERRWWLHETAEALEEIPESIGKEERPSTNNRGSPPTPLFTPNWNSIFLTGLSLFLSSWNRPWDEDRNVSDFQGEDLRYSLSFSKIKCEFVLIGSKLVSNRCVILAFVY